MQSFCVSYAHSFYVSSRSPAGVDDQDQIGAFLDAIANSDLAVADALVGGSDENLSDEEGAVMALLAESDDDIEVSALCFCARVVCVRVHDLCFHARCVPCSSEEELSRNSAVPSLKTGKHGYVNSNDPSMILWAGQTATTILKGKSPAAMTVLTCLSATLTAVARVQT